MTESQVAGSDERSLPVAPSSTGHAQGSSDAGGILLGAALYLASVHLFNCAALKVGVDRPLGLSIAALVWSLVPAVLYVVVTGYWRLWIFWNPPNVRSRAFILGAVAALPFLSVAFASLTVLLADEQELGLTASFPTGRNTFGLDGTFGHLELYYLWQVAAAFPLIEPETLDWAKPDYFRGFRAGLLLLAYKVLVVAPVVTVLVATFKRSGD